jgi:hypothetical protein
MALAKNTFPLFSLTPFARLWKISTGRNIANEAEFLDIEIGFKTVYA